MSQSITTWKAYEILHKSFEGVKEETIDALARSGELAVYRVGAVNRVSLDEVQRVLLSWQEQKKAHQSATQYGGGLVLSRTSLADKFFHEV